MPLSSWIGRRKKYRGLLMGYGGDGKTALLYTLMGHPNWASVPTIAFNIEDVKHTSGTQFTLCEVGGCDMIRHVIQKWLPGMEFVIFVVHISSGYSDDERAQEIDWTLKQLREHGVFSIWIVFSGQDLLEADEALIRSQSLRKKMERIAQQAPDIAVHFVDTPGWNAKDVAFGKQLLDDIDQTLKDYLREKSSGRSTDPSKVVLPESRPSSEVLLDRIKRGVVVSQSSDQFWASFLSGSMEEFDHFNHLRAGYFVLLDGLSSGRNIFQCADIFMGHLDRLHRRDANRFRRTAHRSLTIFWLYQLELTISKFRRRAYRIPIRDNFVEVLMRDTSLMDSGLHTQYWNKDTIMSSLAKEQWVLPDLQPLPSHPRFANIDNRQSAEDNADQLASFALFVIQKSFNEGVRRGEVIRRSLEALQSSIIRQRVSDSKVAPYSETQAYFWIQYVHAVLATLSGHNDIDRRTITFPAFKVLFDIKGDEWKTYYSKRVWEDITSRMVFAIPDRKPLPGLIGSSSEIGLQNAKSKMVESFLTTPQLAQSSELWMLASFIWDQDPSDDEEEYDMIEETSLSDAKKQDENTIIKTHADLIQVLFKILRNQFLTIEDRLAKVHRLGTGTTRKLFWAKQVLVALGDKEWQSLEVFLKANLPLAFEGFIGIYYSDVVLKSTDAEQCWLAPDRKSFLEIKPSAES